jgi:hypothetical protein
MRESDMSEFHRYGKSWDEKRRMLREKLRLVRGGKSSDGVQLDRSQLNDDPFLREHYLGNTRRRREDAPLNEQLRFFLFGYRETPPEAG